METAIKIINLPWVTVLTLATGYAGYFLAHVGAREHHRAADITFGTLMFGFWGLFAYLLATHVIGESLFVTALIAMVATCVMGCGWAVVGRRLLIWALEKSGVSHSDDLPSAWVALGLERGVEAIQLGVLTRDGTVYRCDDLERFKDQPNGAFVLGGNGDMLMYATHVKFPEDQKFEEIAAVDDADWGAEIIYLPRDQIARVDLRRRMKA